MKHQHAFDGERGHLAVQSRRKNKAFEWLQISLDNHDSALVSLLIAVMRNLRHDSRHGEMLTKVGLAPSEGERSIYLQ